MSTTYIVTTTIQLSLSVTDLDGVAANATGGAVLTVKAPDGTTSTPTVSNPATGTYTAALTLTQAGRYDYEWQTSGTPLVAVDGSVTARLSRVDG